MFCQLNGLFTVGNVNPSMFIDLVYARVYDRRKSTTGIVLDQNINSLLPITKIASRNKSGKNMTDFSFQFHRL